METEWKNADKGIDTVNRISASAFATRFNADNPVVIDIRRTSEYSAEHVEGAINIPLDDINNNLTQFPKEQPFIIHCGSGYRTMIAASILKARGWENFADVVGGLAAISKTNVAKSAYVCPSTLKK